MSGYCTGCTVQYGKEWRLKILKVPQYYVGGRYVTTWREPRVCVFDRAERMSCLLAFTSSRQQQVMEKTVTWPSGEGPDERPSSIKARLHENRHICLHPKPPNRLTA